jgi:hypothetical protein
VTPDSAPTPALLEQRKQNLLLASRLARGQAVIAIDEIGGQADRVADTLVRVRDWVTSPLLWMVGSSVGALVLTLKGRKARSLGLLRWIWPAWRAWRTWRAVSGGAAGPRGATASARERANSPPVGP